MREVLQDPKKLQTSLMDGPEADYVAERWQDDDLIATAVEKMLSERSSVPSSIFTLSTSPTSMPAGMRDSDSHSPRGDTYTMSAPGGGSSKGDNSTNWLFKYSIIFGCFGLTLTGGEWLII